VLMGKDKFDGCSINISRALCFQDCLNNCRMIDIGYSGPRFTWSNHHPLSQLVQERIDRVFVNAEWNSLFSEANVLQLEKTHSNHYPIKLCFEKDGGLQFPKPFCFQPMWLSDPSFPGVVKEAWNNTPSLH